MKVEVPMGWETTTLGDVARWGSGGTPSRRNPEFFNGSIPWIKTGELGDKFISGTEEHISEDAIKKSSAKIFSAGSVGIAMYGATIGKLSIFAVDASTNQACAVAKPLCDLLSNEFLYYYLLSERRALIDSGKGGAQPNISQGILRDWPLSLPPLNEQHRIVAKIETLFSEMDKGIESLKIAREQLKVYRQAVLKNAFEGKLTSQWREQNKDKLATARQLLASANQNIDSQLKAPSSWIVCRVEDVLILGPSNGRSVKDRKDGFPVLRLTALKGGKIELSESKSGDWNRDEAQAYIVKEGDFLLSRGNGSKHLVGRGGVVPKHEDEVAYPDTIVRLRVNPELILIKFFSLLWESRVLRDQIEAASQTTAGIYKINQGHIKAFAVPVPTLAEQQLIVRELEEKMSLIDHQLHDVDLAIAASETLRQSILKKAFSGQLVPQDPSDEPASALLARIQSEKSASAMSKASHKNSPAKGGRKARSKEAS